MQQIGPLTIHTHRNVSIVIPKIPKIQLKFDKHESTKKKRTVMKIIRIIITQSQHTNLVLVSNRGTLEG